MVPLSQNTTLLLIHSPNLHNNEAEWINGNIGVTENWGYLRMSGLLWLSELAP
jgi:hypothetical protein